MRGTQFGRPLRRHTLLSALILGLALAATFAATAGAGPAGPTLTLAELQTRLAAGPLDGAMITTVQGSTPVSIPVDVLAVVESYTWGKLILFESNDTRIVDNGGIAAGMSGSPLYVDDGGTSKLVGAVSYGEEFSLGGTGLATPIEYMSQEQDKYGAAGATAASTTLTAGPSRRETLKLASPVRTTSGVVRSLVLAANAETAASASAAAGQIVMHPLALAQIGGLPVASNAYKKLAAKLENAGLTVVPATASLGAEVTTPALEAGSPCGVLFSNGLYWMGVMGTITYVDGTTAMAFGHPVLGDLWGWGLGIGSLQGTLTGATVEGIWPSLASPYKMMTPADAKGTAIEDRSAGLIAIIGDSSARSSEFPVTTSVTVNGAGPVVDTTNVGQWFTTSYWPGSVSEWGMGDPGAVGMLVSAGLYHALDRDATSGGGATTTTVVVHEPGGSPITIAHNNIWDASGENGALADLAAADAGSIVASLVNDQYGLRHVVVDSVNVTASLSSTRRYAGLADLQLSRALKVGDNDVSARYYQYGSPALQTQHVTLTIPAGTSLNGSLDVLSAEAAAERGYGYMGDSEPADAPETVAQIAAQLNAAGTNGDLVVVYTPKGDGSDDFDSEPTAAAEATIHTGWVFSGYITKQTAEVKMQAPAKVSLGAPVLVTGMVTGATGDVPVAIYRARAGKPEPAAPAQTVTATYAKGVATFTAMLPPSSHTEVVTAEVAALTDDSLPGGASDTVEVRARVSLSAKKAGAKILLSASVRPKDCGGKVLFQRRVAGRWVKVAKVAVGRGGVARASLKAKTIPVLRAKFMGNAGNAASAWAMVPAGR